MAYHLLSSLHACLFAFLLSCLFVLCLFHMLFAFVPSVACLLVSCFCLCMYTHGARMHGVRAGFPRHKQKGRGCEHADISQVAMFSSFRSLTSPICLCTLLKPPSFLPHFPLRWVVLGISCHVPFVLIFRA